MADRVAGPVVTALLSVAAMAQALKVWQWRPGDPVDLSGDSASLLAGFKDMLDHGWYGSNPDLGAPFHQDASWFPHADHLHLFLTGKVIGLFSDNPFTVSAIYFFLGFPLAALSMYWLARQRHLGRLGSVVAGVLFSVVPGHQTMFQHLWLASYWVVPLGMWLVLRAALGEPLFRLKVDWRDPAQRRSALPLNLTTAFCVLCIAIGGIYYSAFTLLLLAVTLLVRLVATRDPRSVARASLLLAAIGALSLTAVVSVAAGQDKSTLVTTPSQRGFWESEKYAGKAHGSDPAVDPPPGRRPAVPHRRLQQPHHADSRRAGVGGHCAGRRRRAAGDHVVHAGPSAGQAGPPGARDARRAHRGRPLLLLDRRARVLRRTVRDPPDPHLVPPVHRHRALRAPGSRSLGERGQPQEPHPWPAHSRSAAASSECSTRRTRPWPPTTRTCAARSQT